MNDVRLDDRFVDLTSIGELSRKLVQTKKHRVYHLVYLLVRLALLLPVATTTVERAFSAMKLVKTSLRNRLGDGLMNDYLLTYIEKDVVRCIETEDVIVRFQ